MNVNVELSDEVAKQIAQAIDALNTRYSASGVEEFVRDSIAYALNSLREEGLLGAQSWVELVF